MANPTTNYGFVLPTPTDLVTDLPADFDVALQGVDTQMKTNADAAIAKTIVDAKGDLIAGTGSDTVSRLAVGSNDQILVADSTTATGLKWAAPAGGGGMTSIATGSLSGTSTSITSISGSYIDLCLVINGMKSTSGNFEMTFNSDGGSNYGFSTVKGTSVGAAVNTTAFFPDLSTPTINNSIFIMNLRNYSSTAAIKSFDFQGGRDDQTNTYSYGSGIYNSASAITSIQINNGSNFTGGTYILYGVK